MLVAQESHAVGASSVYRDEDDIRSLRVDAQTCTQQEEGEKKG